MKPLPTLKEAEQRARRAVIRAHLLAAKGKVWQAVQTLELDRSYFYALCRRDPELRNILRASRARPTTPRALTGRKEVMYRGNTRGSHE